MKILVIFVGLKIAETVGLCTAILLLAIFGKGIEILIDLVQNDPFTVGGFVNCFLKGLIGYAVLIFSTGAITTIIRANWKWAKRLGREK